MHTRLAVAQHRQAGRSRTVDSCSSIASFKTQLINPTVGAALMHGMPHCKMTKVACHKMAEQKEFADNTHARLGCSSSIVFCLSKSETVKNKETKLLTILQMSMHKAQLKLCVCRLLLLLSLLLLLHLAKMTKSSPKFECNCPFWPSVPAAGSL